MMNDDCKLYDSNSNDVIISNISNMMNDDCKVNDSNSNDDNDLNNELYVKMN